MWWWGRRFCWWAGHEDRVVDGDVDADSEDEEVVLILKIQMIMTM